MQAKYSKPSPDSLTPKTSGDFTYFPGGVSIAQHLSPTAFHAKALNKLLSGQTKTVRLEKLHHKHNLYSIRANKGARIIGICDSGSFKVLALYDKHQYKRLKLLNVSGINHSVIDLEAQTDETEVINLALNHVQSDGDNYWRQGHFINRQAIFFSNVQEQVINTNVLPLIVTGAAGSGKTLIIVTMLVKAYLAGTQNCVYVCPTTHLAEHAQKVFEGLLASFDSSNQDKPNFAFLSVEQFIELNKAPHTRRATQESLLSWLQALHSKNKTVSKLLSNPQLILEEFKTIALLTKKDYNKLGGQQSLYTTKEEKDACFDLYELYTKKHPEVCQMAFPRLDNDVAKYDLLIVDEGQSFTIKQLQEITKCAIKGQFLVFGDPLQNFNNRISVFPQLKQILCERHHIQDPIIILPTTYRNPLPVIHFANNVIRTRRLLLGGINDKCETIALVAPEPNDSESFPVEWIERLDETKIKELAVVLNEPDSMLITGNEGGRQKADTLFNNPLILFPEHAQGLEASTVFVYCLFTPELIRQINKYLQGVNLDEDHRNLPKKNKGTHEFTSDLNQLFTAVTRVAQANGRLIVYMGEYLPKHDCEVFFSLLNKNVVNGHSVKTTSEVKAATKKDWHEWVKKIYLSGNKEEAFRVFCKNVSTNQNEFELCVGAVPHAPPPAPSAVIIRETPLPSKINAIANSNPKQNKKTNPQSTNQNKLSLFQPNVTQNVEKKSPDNLSPKESIYLNNLLDIFNIGSIKLLLKHKRAASLLFCNFKAIKLNVTTSLCDTILTSPNYLSILIETIREDMFLASGRLISGLMFNSLRVLFPTLPELRNDLITLLDLLITIQPDLTKNIKFASLKYLFNALCFSSKGQEALLKMINNQEEPFFNLIQSYLDSNQTDHEKWFYELMINPHGSALIIFLDDINPKFLSLVTYDKLKEYESDCKNNSTPIDYWLSTSFRGQRVLHKLRKHPASLMDQNQEVMKTTENLSLARGIVEATIESATYFTPTLEELKLVLDISKMLPHQKDVCMEKLVELLKNPNAGALLFDIIGESTQNLFTRIASNQNLLVLFHEALISTTDFRHIFSMQRLSQEISTFDAFGNLTVSSVLYILANLNEYFLFDLLRLMPEVKEYFNSELLLKTNSTNFLKIHKLGFQNTKQTSLLKLMSSDSNYLRMFDVLEEFEITPQFCAQLFRIETIESQKDETHKEFIFFNLYRFNPQLIFRFISIEPRILNYFNSDHLNTPLYDSHAPQSKQPGTFFHLLCQSEEGRTLLFKILEHNPDSILTLPLESFVFRITQVNTIIHLLTQTGHGFTLLNLMISEFRPQIPLVLKYQELLEKSKSKFSDDLPFDSTTFENLCYFSSLLGDYKLLGLIMDSATGSPSRNNISLFSRPELSLYKLCKTPRSIDILQTIFSDSNSLCSNITKEVFYKPSTCNNKSMFQNLLELQPAQEGKEKIVQLIFRLNPGLINVYKTSKLSLSEKIKRAISIQEKTLEAMGHGPGFFPTQTVTQNELAGKKTPAPK